MATFTSAFQQRGPRRIVREATITRPADTTPYTSGDAVSALTSAGVASIFTGLPKNWSGIIRSVTLIKSTAGTTNAAFRVHLLDTNPTSEINDNAALSLSDAEAAQLLPGSPIDLPNADIYALALNAGWGKTNLDIPFVVDNDGQLYAVLEVRGAYTPGSAEVFTLRLGMEMDG